MFFHRKHQQSCTDPTILGGGFKYFLFSPLFGEMIQFHSYFSNGLKPPSSISLYGLVCWTGKDISTQGVFFWCCADVIPGLKSGNLDTNIYMCMIYIRICIEYTIYVYLYLYIHIIYILIYR